MKSRPSKITRATCACTHRMSPLTPEIGTKLKITKDRYFRHIPASWNQYSSDTICFIRAWNMIETSIFFIYLVFNGKGWHVAHLQRLFFAWFRDLLLGLLTNMWDFWVVINFVRASCLAIILTIIVGFVCAQVSSRNYETMESQKIFCLQTGSHVRILSKCGLFCQETICCQS